MPQAPIIEPAASLDDVDREIAGGFPFLSFAPPIERQFRRDSLPGRVGMFGITAFVASALYNLFLISDWLTLHDRFPEMVVARLGIFTPTITLGILISRRVRTASQLDLIGVFAAVLAVLLPMVAFVFSETPYRLNYQYGSLLVMLFTTVVQRLSFRYALLALGLMFSEQIAAVYLSHAFDFEIFVPIVTFFATGCALLATTAYYLERVDRRSYLLGVRAALLHAQWAALARTDALTGLSNRRHLDAVAAGIEVAAEPRPVAAILLDIDHFKAFNDSQGHIAGDACLRRVSACIAAAVAGGHAFRYGGEEMLILLEGVDQHGAYAVAEAVRLAIRAEAIPHPASSPDAVVSASFGLAATMIPEGRIADLVAAADTALYAAKYAGRNRVWPPLRPSSAPGAERIAA